MNVGGLRKTRRPAERPLAKAASRALELMERRVLMSSTIAGWGFTAAESTSAALVSPSAAAAGVSVTNNQAAGTPTLTAIGMAESGTASTEDIALTAGTAHASFSEDLWRIRGSGTGSNGDNNGWWLQAPEYTQGAEIDVNTTGYTSVGLSFDWYSTTSGVKNLMVQYNTNVGNANGWTNLLSTPLVATSNDYYGGAAASPTNTLSLSGVSGAANDPNFGIRLVSAYDPNFPASTGYSAANSPASGTQTLISNTGGNWRFGNIQVTGTTLVAPTVTTQPTNQTVAVGTTATFTAAASGSPTPTVQWDVSTNGGTTFTPDTTDAGNTTGTLSVVASAANSGYEYEAVFSNSQGSATTAAATLTATTTPTITAQPTSQFTTAGDTVSFTAVAAGSPTPTVQWQVSTNGGSTFTNITGATSTTYSFTATEGLTGNVYQAVFTSTSGNITSNPATLTVNGTPLAQWDFAGTQGAASNSSTAPGTSNSPYPTLGSSSVDSAGTLGLANDYTGTYSFPEADILSERSTVNPNVVEYMWRVRGGGGGTSGTPGVPDGWSQEAPEYTQGVVFDVDTVGYSNITLHYDWLQGGPGDMQAQYSPDGGNTWVNVGGLITATGTDFAGVSSGAVTSPANPTSSSNPVGIEVSLAGIAAANNNPKFQLRLVSAYDPRLPEITDGNALDPTVHGQYAASGGNVGPVDDQQVLTLNGTDNFTLTFNGQTTAPITYSSTPATMEANIAAALGALSNVNGTANVGLTQVYPQGSLPLYEVTFKGALADTNLPTMTISDASGTDTAATWTQGSTSGVSPFVDGSGSWTLGNINFFGDVSTNAPGITAQPAASTVVGGSAATFTATAYSESIPTVQWQVSTNGGGSWANVTAGTTTPTSFTTAAANGSYTSTYSFTTDLNNDQTGFQYRAVFTNANGPTDTQAATLTVVAPVAPTVTTQPSSTSVQAGKVAVFTAAANGSPAPTIQWQINSGSGWVNLVNSATVSGATTTTLRYTTAANASENGDLIRALFSGDNSSGPISVPSNAVTLTVLAAEAVLTDWDFNNTYPTVTSATGSPDPYVNSPAPVAAGVDGSVDVGGTAYAVGMNEPYNAADQATIGTNGAVNADDVTSSPGSANPNYVENTWRIRSGVSATVGGQPANGWSNFAPEYTQGVQFNAPTTGYGNVYVTMDWYSTTSGILDAQPQYTVSSTTAAITAVSASAANSSVTLTANNTFAVGDSVTVSNLPSAYAGLDGVFTVTAATPTSFSYYLYVPADIATTPVATGTATDSVWVNLGPQVQAFSNDFYGATTGNEVNVSAESLTNNVATLTAPNTFAVGDTVSIAGADTQFNGTFTITAATASTFSYALVGANVATKALINATAIDGGIPIPLVFDVSQIPGAANNPNFGIRLVSAYNPILTAENGGVGEYANATSPTNPVVYNGSKGNWRFDNIVFHGTPTTTTALVNNGSATSNATQVLRYTATVTGGVPNGETVALEDASNGNAIVATATLAGGTATFTVPAGTLLAGTHNLFAVYAGDGTYAGSQSATVTQTVQVVVTNVTVNGNIAGLAGAQRSMVDSIVYTFSEAVNIAAANAFSIAVHGGQTGTAPTLVWTALNPNSDGSSTEWVVTFAGNGVVGGSIANGVYDITMNGAAVTSDADPAVAAQARATDTFYRLFGDYSSTARVSTADYNYFLTAYGLKSGTAGYLAAFDYGGTGAKISTADYSEFLADYGLRYTGFSATI